MYDVHEELQTQCAGHDVNGYKESLQDTPFVVQFKFVYPVSHHKTQFVQVTSHCVHSSGHVADPPEYTTMLLPLFIVCHKNVQLAISHESQFCTYQELQLHCAYKVIIVHDISVKLFTD